MKLHWLWWTLGSLMLIAVLFFCLTPVSFSDGAVVPIDKLMHGFTFAVLTIWFGGLLRNQSLRAWVMLLVALSAYGVLIEVLQAQIAYRSAEWNDFVADLVGIEIGLIMLSAGLYRWPVWLERYVLRRNRT